MSVRCKQSAHNRDGNLAGEPVQSPRLVLRHPFMQRLQHRSCTRSMAPIAVANTHPRKDYIDQRNEQPCAEEMLWRPVAPTTKINLDNGEHRMHGLLVWRLKLAYKSQQTIFFYQRQCAGHRLHSTLAAAPGCGTDTSRCWHRKTHGAVLTREKAQRVDAKAALATTHKVFLHTQKFLPDGCTGDDVLQRQITHLNNFTRRNMAESPWCGHETTSPSILFFGVIGIRRTAVCKHAQPMEKSDTLDTLHNVHVDCKDTNETRKVLLESSFWEHTKPNSGCCYFRCELASNIVWAVVVTFKGVKHRQGRMARNEILTNRIHVEIHLRTTTL
mmetsp:Transcript_15899/g.43570  ORF Transcript_15899/g.43570 Transcript_15899/m.43570 type:complete len:329 (-) Transcript_15899:424-1410(-)